MSEKVYNELLEVITKEQIKIDEEMKKHTSFKIGGKADIYVVANTIENIRSTIEISKRNNTPLTILGNGTNMLVGDNGIDGIVLKIAIQEFKIDKTDKAAVVSVNSGMTLAKLAQILFKEEITGFEFAAGIPGTIGGAIRMNAGAHGREMRDCIKEVTYIDIYKNEIKKISNEECKFEYRNSMFSSDKHVIISCIMEFDMGKQEEIKARMLEYAESRKSKQPLEFPSAGSTFKRGKDFITSKLIDECGLKGYSVGDAQVSEKHAGFIVNKGNAKANDILNLIEYVKKVVFEKTGKNIELEVELIGKF